MRRIALAFGISTGLDTISQDDDRGIPQSGNATADARQSYPLHPASAT